MLYDFDQDIEKGFESEGFKVEVQPLTYFQDDYGLKGEDGEDEAEMDEDVEDGGESSEEEDD